MIYLLFHIKPRLFSRLIVKKGIGHWAKVVVAFLVIAGFFYGAYSLFYWVFSYLVTVETIGAILTDRLLAVGFFAFFFMLLISNIVSSISTLFRNREAEYLLSTPLASNNVFWARFIDNFLYSSWATVVVGLPMALAYIVAFKMAWYNVLLMFFLLMLFLIIPAYIGCIISMCLFTVSKKFGFKKTVAILSAITLGIIALYYRTNVSGGIWFNIQGDLSALNYYLRELGTYKSPFFPHIWFAESMRAIRFNDWSLVLVYISALASSTLFGAFITNIVARKLYFLSFESAGIVLGKTAIKRRSIISSRLWNFFSVFSADMRALLVKDVKLFLRDPNQWSQFAVLLVLLGVYLVNLRHIPAKTESLLWQTVISFVNFAFCGYILATLSVRFVYPSISMEGKSLWSIISAPLPIVKLVWEKFWLSFIVFFIIAEIVAVVSNGILSQSRYMVALTFTGIFLMSASLTSLNIGLGILFPNFEELNPMRIASSGGGMISALLSLFYVGLVVTIVAIPTHRYSAHLVFNKPFSWWEIVVALFLIIVVNLLTIFIPIKLGLRKIGQKEF